MAFYLLNPFLLMQHDLEFRNTKDFSGSKKINKSNLIYFQYPFSFHSFDLYLQYVKRWLISDSINTKETKEKKSK